MEIRAVGHRAERRVGAAFVAASIVVLAAGATAQIVGSGGAPTPTATVAASPAQHIKHVVVFYQENHSFDETLGRYCEVHTGRCDGYTGAVKLANGTTVRMHQSPDVVPDVWHDVRSQDQAIHGGAMDGWNRVTGCRSSDGYGCLTYYAPSQIPNLAALADKYVIADRTFSMADSPSWGGHVYPAAATLDNFTGELPEAAPGVTAGPGWGCDSRKVAEWVNPATKLISLQPSCIPAKPGTLPASKYPFNGAFRATPVQYVPTIFDRLDAKHLSWKLYSSHPIGTDGSGWSICPNFAECLYGPQRAHLVPETDIVTDAKNGQLPAYSVLLPGGPAGTSQHNGASMLAGDNWIGEMLNDLERSPQWSSTAVFITYDDCGCFYDHVAPGLNPDGTKQGIRVPVVIVSPFAKVGFTDQHPATFASILRFSEEAFGLSALSTNDLHAYDFANSFDYTLPPSGPRVRLTQHAVSAASRRYIAAHPEDPDDPT